MGFDRDPLIATIVVRVQRHFRIHDHATRRDGRQIPFQQRSCRNTIAERADCQIHTRTSEIGGSIAQVRDAAVLGRCLPGNSHAFNGRQSIDAHYHLFRVAALGYTVVRYDKIDGMIADIVSPGHPAEDLGLRIERRSRGQVANRVSQVIAISIQRSDTELNRFAFHDRLVPDCGQLGRVIQQPGRRTRTQVIDKGGERKQLIDCPRQRIDAEYSRTRWPIPDVGSVEHAIAIRQTRPHIEPPNLLQKARIQQRGMQSA